MNTPLPHNALSFLRRQGPIRRLGCCLKDSRSSAFVCFRTTCGYGSLLSEGRRSMLDADPEHLPFAQRLRVARRDVREFGVAADGREDFPRPRALGADGFLDDDS